jgi:hypothetical protein
MLLLLVPCCYCCFALAVAAGALLLLLVPCCYCCFAATALLLLLLVPCCCCCYLSCYIYACCCYIYAVAICITGILKN